MEEFFWVCGKATTGEVFADSIRAKNEDDAEARFLARFMDNDHNLTTEFKSVTAKREDYVYAFKRAS